MDRISRNSLILSLTFVGLYLLGMLLPEPFWGLSHLAYLSPFQIGLFASVLALMAIFGNRIQKGTFRIPSFHSADRWIPVGLALGMAALVYAFPLVHDSYGDGISFRRNINYEGVPWNTALLWELLYWSPFDSKIGSGSFYAFVNTTAALTGKSGIEALYLLEAVSMALFTWIWAQWVLRRFSDSTWRLALLASGLFSPIVLIFTGHFETYAFSLTAFLGYLSLLDHHFGKPSAKSMIGLAFVWMLCLKVHFISHLLLPSLGLAALWWLGQSNPKVRLLFTWKYALRFLFLPGLIGLILIYLIPFGGWNIPRSFTIDTLSKAFFLPVIAPEPAPMDGYNLFSGAHILDYLNMVFLWAPGALFLGLGALLTGRRSIQWNSPVLVVFAVLMLVFGTVFFLLNPLLTMPVDWDLCSLPAPIFMGLTLVLAGQLKERKQSRIVPWAAFGISFLAWSFWWLHLSPEGVSQRYEDTGKWGFKTYWIGASTQVLEGIGMEADLAIRAQRFDLARAELEPYAHKGDDLEYAGLLLGIGKFHFEQQAFEKATSSFLQAYAYQPELASLPYYLVTSLFVEGRFEEASAHCPELVRQGFPNRSKALRMAVHTCIEAGNQAGALECADLLAEREPEDAFNLKVRDALRNGKSTSEMRSWFRQN